MKLKTLIKRYAAADTRSNEIMAFTEYPYKAGHMECVNRYTDTWEPTKRNQNMLNTQYNKMCELDAQIEKLIITEGISFDVFSKTCEEAGIWHQTIIEDFDELGAE